MREPQRGRQTAAGAVTPPKPTTPPPPPPPPAPLETCACGDRALLLADVERLRRDLVDAETAREHYASATGVLAAERDEARAEAERLSAQRADALAAADGWESDSAAFSTVPGFRRYVVDGVREALGATDGD